MSDPNLVFNIPPPPPHFPARMIHIIEILEDSDSDSDMMTDNVVDVQESPISETVLNVYVDIAISTEKFVDEQIKKKAKIPQAFVEQLMTQIDSAIIIFHSIPPDHDLKFDFGAVLQDLKKQKFKIDQYMHKTKRKSSSWQAKVEAYQDPEIACYAELSKDGLKTRNRFYKRK